MSDNIYFKHEDGELAQTDNALIAEALERSGFTRINRATHRKLTRERKHVKSHDHRAQGESADEREDA